jgi:hypothetical protein
MRYAWQVRFNTRDVEVHPRIDKPGDSRIVDQLRKKFSDLRRAYSKDGLSLDDFDSFARTRRIPRQFITACHDLDGEVRDFMLRNPV